MGDGERQRGREGERERGREGERERGREGESEGLLRLSHQEPWSAGGARCTAPQRASCTRASTPASVDSKHDVFCVVVSNNTK